MRRSIPVSLELLRLLFIKFVLDENQIAEIVANAT